MLIKTTQEIAASEITPSTVFRARAVKNSRRQRYQWLSVSGISG